jgi:hypothetical protein
LKTGSVSQYTSEFQIFRWGKRLQNSPLFKELHLDQLGAREDFEARIQLILLHKANGGSQFVNELLNPQLGYPDAE